MSIDTPTVQHVRSHAAAIDRRAFEIADHFLDAFFQASPALRPRFTGAHERQRRAFAHRWAWFVRHLGHLDQVSPELDALGSFLRSRGMNYNDFRTARACLLEATRDAAIACGTSWTTPDETDWATAIDECLRVMSPAKSMVYAQAA